MRTEGSSNLLDIGRDEVTKVAKPCRMQSPKTIIYGGLLQDDVRPNVSSYDHVGPPRSRRYWIACMPACSYFRGADIRPNANRRCPS